jgi:hypothetical protein
VLKEPKSLNEFKPKSFKEYYNGDEELSWESDDDEEQKRKE